MGNFPDETKFSSICTENKPKAGQAHVQLSVNFSPFAEDEFYPEASDLLFLFWM